MRRAGLGLALTLAIGLAAPGTAAAVSDPVKVMAGPEDQFHPSANETYLIWTQNSRAHPSRHHAYGRVLGSDSRFRLNPPGTRGFAGGLDPDQDRAIYQQIGPGSDLYVFNLETRNRARLAAPISTARWERDPRISNAFILFAREAGGTTSLLLYDRTAQTLDRIGHWDLSRYFVAPGSVSERYATWTVCGPLSCNAFVHDSVSDDRTKIAAPAGKAQYAPVASDVDGSVYFVRSGQACGSSVSIRRVPVTAPAGPSERLVRLPSGIDADWTMSLHRADNGRLDIWFSRYRCAPAQGDLYKLRDVAP